MKQANLVKRQCLLRQTRASPQKRTTRPVPRKISRFSTSEAYCRSSRLRARPTSLPTRKRRGLLEMFHLVSGAWLLIPVQFLSTNKVSAFSPVGCLLVQSLMKFPFDCVDFLFNTYVMLPLFIRSLVVLMKGKKWPCSFLTLDAEFLVSMGTDSAASRVIEVGGRSCPVLKRVH